MSPRLPRPGIHRWLSEFTSFLIWNANFVCICIRVLSLGEKVQRFSASQSGSVGMLKLQNPKGFFLLLQALLTFSSLRNIIFLINTPELLTNDNKGKYYSPLTPGDTMLKQRVEKGKVKRVRDNVEALDGTQKMATLIGYY